MGITTGRSVLIMGQEELMSQIAELERKIAMKLS